MQLTQTELPPIPVLCGDSDFERFEPKRIVLSPLELCFLSEPDDFFDDLD
jgi:hypothetical protein